MDIPPPLVSFTTVNDLLEALGVETSRDETLLIEQLVEKGLPPATSLQALSVLFGYSKRFLVAMRRRPRRYYRHFVLKMGRKARRIDAPRVALKVIQTWLGHYLARGIELPGNVHGFVPQRSTVTAAATHCPSSWILQIDLRDFFAHCSRDSVTAGLRSIGYCVEAAELIADLTLLDGGLPQGSPASPVLANLAFARTDLSIANAIDGLDVRYTRYADDLTFSGVGMFPTDLERLLIATLRKDSWEVAPEKTRVAQSPNQRVVLGLLVNGDRPRLPKEYRRRIRAMQHRVDRGDADITQVDVIRGHIAYAKSVDDVDAVKD